MTLKLKNVPPRNGLRWVRQGFTVFFHRPLPYAAMFGTFMFGTLVLLMVPVIGSALLMAWLPLVTLAFMMATHLVLQRRTPTPTLLVRPLGRDARRRGALIKLGAIYAVSSFVILLLGEWADAGKFSQLQELVVDADQHQAEIVELLGDSQLLFGMIVRLGLAGLLAVPFWHAPALVYWDRQGAAQALFSSSLACWRARGAFAFYGLGWIGVTVAFSIAANLVFALLAAPQFAGLAALAAGLIFSTAFYASLYFSFADSFEVAAAQVLPITDEAAPPTVPQDEPPGP